MAPARIDTPPRIVSGIFRGDTASVCPSRPPRRFLSWNPKRMIVRAGRCASPATTGEKSRNGEKGILPQRQSLAQTLSTRDERCDHRPWLFLAFLIGAQE